MMLLHRELRANGSRRSIATSLHVTQLIIIYYRACSSAASLMQNLLHSSTTVVLNESFLIYCIYKGLFSSSSNLAATAHRCNFS